MTMRQAAGGAGDVDQPWQSSEEELEKEARGEPDDGPEGGTVPAIKGTSLAGPTGGTVVAVTDGALGSTVDPDPDRTAHEELDDVEERR
jgi:hypothetical protein